MPRAKAEQYNRTSGGTLFAPCCW